MVFGGIGPCSASKEIRFGGAELRLMSTYAAAMLPNSIAHAVVEKVGSVRPSREMMRIDLSWLCASRPRHVKESECAKVATVSYCAKVNGGKPEMIGRQGEARRRGRGQPRPHPLILANSWL